MNSRSHPSDQTPGTKAEARTEASEIASAMRPVRLLLAALIAIPVFIFFVAAWMSYQQQLEEARDRVQRNLNTTYEHALKVFETFELSTRYIAEMTRDLGDREIIANEADYHSRLHSLTSTSPQLRDIVVISKAGAPLVSSRVFPTPDFDLSDREYFIAQKERIVSGTYVGAPISGRSSHADSVPLTRARTDDKGDFAGVIFVSISPKYFYDFYSRLPPPGSFGLIRGDGTILARFPEPRTRQERLPPDNPLMQSIASHPEDGMVSPNSLFDSTPWVFAYRKMPKYDIYVATGIETEAVIGNWLRTLGSHLMFGLPATLAIVGLGFFALRRTRREAFAYTKLQQEVARRERTELALHQALKMEAVGRLTGGIAHDFNNLLTAILGNVDLALRRVNSGDERLKRALNSARQASERAANLVQRLLAFSRQHPLAVKAVNVNLLVQEISELIRRTIGETITVETRLADDLWMTAVDPNQLESALLNLAVNARDAMKDGGKLTVETSNVYVDMARIGNGGDGNRGPGLALDQYVLVTVTDTGTGMTEEVRSRAFEPFFTTKPTGAGSGLGLSMVYGFIKQSGGHIRINSEVGMGTSIWLYLPRLVDSSNIEPWRPEAAASSADTDDTPRRPEKILLVEDEEEVNRFSTEVLRDKGYQVISTHEGASALRLLDANPDVRLLFTDVVLPGGMNGRQLADEARRRHPHLKVLYTTGYTRDAIIHQGRLDSDVDLLTKPFTAEALRRKIRQILDMEARDPMVRVNAILENMKEKPQASAPEAAAKPDTTRPEPTRGRKRKVTPGSIERG